MTKYLKDDLDVETKYKYCVVQYINPKQNKGCNNCYYRVKYACETIEELREYNQTIKDEPFRTISFEIGKWAIYDPTEEQLENVENEYNKLDKLCGRYLESLETQKRSHEIRTADTIVDGGKKNPNISTGTALTKSQKKNKKHSQHIKKHIGKDDDTDDTNDNNNDNDDNDDTNDNDNELDIDPSLISSFDVNTRSVSENTNESRNYISVNNEPMNLFYAVSYLSYEGLINSYIRGIKIRGVFATKDDLEKHILELQKDDLHFDIYTEEIGVWTIFNPNINDMQNVIYREKEINDIMNKNKKTKDDTTGNKKNETKTNTEKVEKFLKEEPANKNSKRYKKYIKLREEQANKNNTQQPCSQSSNNEKSVAKNTFTNPDFDKSYNASVMDDFNKIKKEHNAEIKKLEKKQHRQDIKKRLQEKLQQNKSNRHEEIKENIESLNKEISETKTDLEKLREMAGLPSQP